MVKSEELKDPKCRAKLAELNGESFSAIIGQSQGKVIGVCGRQASQKNGSLFQVQLYEECLSLRLNPSAHVHMDG